MSELDEYLFDRAEWTARIKGQIKPWMGDAAGEGAKRTITVARKLGLDAAWDVTNPAVQTWLEGYAFKFAEKISSTASDALSQIISAGLSDGQTLREIERAILDSPIMGPACDDYRAEMIARTETARAASEGELLQGQVINEDAISAGNGPVFVAKVWMAAPDCCDFCADMDGTTIDMEEVFLKVGDTVDLGDGGSYTLGYEDANGPPLHPNCLLPGTRCETPGAIIAGHRAWYDGPTVELTFANGSSLAVTANHILLTRDGFARAQTICKGDYLFDCSNLERIIGSDPDNHNCPALIEDIVSSFSKTGGVSTRSVPVSPEYFHGDGCFIQGDIHVVGADSFLADAVEPEIVEFANEAEFGGADVRLTSLTRDSSLAQLFKRAADTADGIMGRSRKELSVIGAGLCHPGVHSGASATRDYTEGQESVTNTTPADVESLRQLLLTDPGLIQLTQVVDINIGSFRGHVYDLQTDSSLYIANTVLSSNCRCAVNMEVSEEYK